MPTRQRGTKHDQLSIMHSDICTICSSFKHDQSSSENLRGGGGGGGSQTARQRWTDREEREREWERERETETERQRETQRDERKNGLPWCRRWACWREHRTCDTRRRSSRLCLLGLSGRPGVLCHWLLWELTFQCTCTTPWLKSQRRNQMVLHYLLNKETKPKAQEKPQLWDFQM